MDKLTLNNQIVSMRQEVKKAKLYTINKLIRESRRLKGRNGPEEGKKKYKRKAERLMEEVLIMKKLKDDDLSKFALCSAKMPGEIIADPAAPIKEKVLARVSSQPNIMACVTQFHMKYPTGVKILPQLLLKLGEKARKKKRKKIKTCQNEQDKATLSSKNVICTRESICNKDQTSMSLIHDGTIMIHNQERQQKAPVSAGKTPKELSEERSKNSVCLKSDPVTARKTPEELSEKISKDSVCVKSETKMTENSLAEVKRFTELLNEENNIENDSLDVVSLTSVDSTCAATVDPFFVYEDGETEYLTSVKVDASSSEEGDIYKRKRLSKSVRNKNDEKRFFQAERRKSMQEQKQKNSNFKAFQQQSTNISRTRSKQSSFSRQKTSVSRDEKKQSPLTDNNGPIHPSWEAKKKLREQQCAVFAFQGKKIKFDD